MSLKETKKGQEGPGQEGRKAQARKAGRPRPGRPRPERPRRPGKEEKKALIRLRIPKKYLETKP